MKTNDDVLTEIRSFFEQIFVLRSKNNGYAYADYKVEWLTQLGLSASDRDEAKASRTTKLQEHLKDKFGERLSIEAPVAKGMTLRFASEDTNIESIDIDSNTLQAFDILDTETGTALEISLSDAFAEFFKDVLKALLDSRVKTLYICMRNHSYKGSKKSGYLKVKDSLMVQQYISLAKLYKLDIFLVDLFPKCNQRF